jgi:hypothetical protein
MLTRRYQDQTTRRLPNRLAELAAVDPLAQARSVTMKDSGLPPVTDGRFLLVANRAMPDCELGRVIVDTCRRHPAAIHVLVSRLRRPVLVADPAVGTASIGGADQQIAVDDVSFRVAEARLDAFMRALSGLGCALSGEIVAHGPLKGARRVLEAGRFDEVLVLTEAVADRRRRRDTVERLRRSSTVPVTPIVVRPVVDLDRPGAA